MQIAEIGVDATTVYTPLGAMYRHRSRWFLGAAVPASASCPAWLVALAILGIPCTSLLSLLLLLIKETDMWSSTLTVTDGHTTFTTTVFTRSIDEYAHIRRVVTWAQQAAQPPRRLPPQLPAGPGPHALPSGQ